MWPSPAFLANPHLRPSNAEAWKVSLLQSFRLLLNTLLRLAHVGVFEWIRIHGWKPSVISTSKLTDRHQTGVVLDFRFVFLRLMLLALVCEGRCVPRYLRRKVQKRLWGGGLGVPRVLLPLLTHWQQLKGFFGWNKAVCAVCSFAAWQEKPVLKRVKPVVMR